MEIRYLMHVPTGRVYMYDGGWASQPDFVEVADASGTPMPEAEPAVEAPADVEQAVAVLARRGRPPKVVPAVDETALFADASRGV